MDKYTVIDRDGTVLDRHLSLAEAAHEILSYDSSEWRIDGEAVDLTELLDDDPAAAAAEVADWPDEHLKRMTVLAIEHNETVEVYRSAHPGTLSTDNVVVVINDRAVFATPSSILAGQWDVERNLFTADSGEVRSLGRLEGWRLVTRKQCANQPWTATVIFSLKSKFSDAVEDIFEQVIQADWPGEPEAILDSKYDDFIEECDG